jgi:hypothetical protein
MEVLDYELFHEDRLTISMRLGIASSKRRKKLAEQKLENICDLERYNDIVNNLAINAFSQYLNSRMYKHWRAYEKGTEAVFSRNKILSLRGVYKQVLSVRCERV